tara:strand:- start:228 stop:536 length:309 start_codon:yes stop_codon:yes gene_type:complete
MSKTELKKINTSVRQGNRNSLGCGATYITSAVGLVKGDWVAIQAVTNQDVILDVDGTSETVVDWDFVSGDLTLEASIPLQTWYGNFTQIKISQGGILAYKRC